MAFHRKLSTSSAIANRLFFAVCTAGLVDGSQRANIWKYVALVVEDNAEDLDSPTGRGYDRYPSVESGSRQGHPA